jgi:ATP-dependent DNA ligase
VTTQRAKAGHTSAHFIEPIVCLAVSDLPDGSKWDHELKLDGYRYRGEEVRSHLPALAKR